MKLRYTKTSSKKIDSHKHDGINPSSGSKSKWGLKGGACFLALLCGAGLSANAQSIGTVVQPVRLTVPVNSSLSSDLSFASSLSTNTTPVHLSLSSLPTGVGYMFSTNDFTNSASGTLTIGTTNVPEGVYTYSLDASGGATRSLLLDIQSAHIWSGATFTNGGTADFSNAGNWVGGNVPGPNSDVVFENSGALGHGDTTTNVLISSDTTIGSLRQAITSGGTRRDNIQINDGVTLNITGTNGVNLGLRDRSDTYQSWEFSFTGNGGTLVVSNKMADFDLFAIENQTPYIYMNDLGTFIADLHQIHFSDYRVYPNYQSMSDNGYSGSALPRRLPAPQFYWARTNIINLNFTGDPYNWTNPAEHQYSMMMGNDSSRSGSTQRHHQYFGITNYFGMNSICFAGAGVSMDGNGAAEFNPSFSSSYNCSAVFRGTNGMNDRMAMFAVADNAGVGASTSSSKAVVDFSGGTVNALVDRLYIAQDRTNANGATSQGTLTMSAGTIDANTVMIGYQVETNYGTGYDYCQGHLNVNGGVFKANKLLSLGYTVDPSGSIYQAESGYGQLTINGGTVMANKITIGGITDVSQDNQINMSAGGTLIVSNTIGTASQPLNTLNMSDSTLTLSVNAANTSPYVYVDSLLTSGSANTINIASLTGVTSYPVTIPVIHYTAAAPNFVVTLPAGLYGYVVNDTANSTIDVVVSQTPPASLVWSGAVSGTWDSTTAGNWTNNVAFANGDFVTFDDSATATNVSVSGTVIPGQSASMPGMLITNNVKDYTFSGGEIAGTAKLLKTGAGMMTFNATTKNTVEVGEGTVMGTGTLGLTTVDTNGTLNFSGTINGLTSMGTAVSSGPINGPVTINAGSFVNSGTITSAPGYINVGNNCSVTNTSAGIIYADTGNWAINSGSIFDNLGEIDNVAGRLYVNSGATYYGSGNLYDASTDLTLGTGRFELQNGALMGIGDSVSNSIGTCGIYARFDFNPGSTIIFDVDMNNAQKNDQINCSMLANIRGTIVMNNIGTTPFSAGQSFQLFNFGGVPNDPQTAHLDYKFEPAAPGIGLQWQAGDNFITNGIVSVVSAPSTPPAITSTVSGNSLNISWPADHIGWVLQVQTNSLSSGLTSTNWYDVPGSQNTTSQTITVDPNSPAVFYRLAN